MACEVNNKEINSQCAELLLRPTYKKQNVIAKNSIRWQINDNSTNHVYNIHT